MVDPTKYGLQLLYPEYVRKSKIWPKITHAWQNVNTNADANDSASNKTFVNADADVDTGTNIRVSSIPLVNFTEPR